tara:strand:+ start:397 stop:1020 length:624 start_codon:yes stop_codon:yes gene_type:complete
MEILIGSGFWSQWMGHLADWWGAAWPWIWMSLAWGLLVSAAALGLLGVFVPVIPGAIVFFLGALIHKLMLPDVFAWWGIGAVGVLMIMDRVVDLFATALGSKWFGGTKWGIFGALAGGLIGLFFGVVGILIGPVIGAVVCELIWARRHPKEAAKSGLGAGLGFGLSVVGRMVIYFMMFGALVFDVVLDREEEVGPIIEVSSDPEVEG